MPLHASTNKTAPMFKAVGEQIRKKRILLNYTQAEVAEKANLASKTFSNLEQGKAKGTFQTYVNIALALDMSLDTILRDVYDPATEPYISMLTNKLRDLSPSQRRLVLEYIESISQFPNLQL